MKILTVDIGTGTQDIFLYDSSLDLENGLKLVLPSPTMRIYRRIKAATREKQAVLLTGFTMGGGPSQWAAEEHAKVGLATYATPDAARSFNDDLAAVQAMGIQIISTDEAQRLPDEVIRLELRDFDFESIYQVFHNFGVNLDKLNAFAVAAFDHGAAPPELSDRQFRFDYLDERIRSENRLSAFAYRSQDIPPILTRLQAIANSAWEVNLPFIVMDSAPAAVLGACYDPIVKARLRRLIANIGNFHTLAFRLGPDGIEGVFEHHTGLLNRSSLEQLMSSLADGSLKHTDVFETQGHGALIYSPDPLPLDHSDYNLVVTGPRRNMLNGSRLKPYFAVPFGDMMIAGCFGLLAACADLLPEQREQIQASLSGKGGSGTPPWEVD